MPVVERQTSKPASSDELSCQAVLIRDGVVAVAWSALGVAGGVVVHDELDFVPGVAKLKLGGGIAGHNGLRDISQRLGSHEYWRMRIGIGHPGDKDAVHDYVLDKPAPEDREAIDRAIATGVDVLPLCLAGDLQGAMLKLHTREKS